MRFDGKFTRQIPCGVHYDEKLTFKSQIQKMMTAASKGLGLLVRLTRIGCRKRTLISILVTVVLARVLYGVESFAWMLPKECFEQLELLVNRAVRLVTGCLRSTKLQRLYKEADTPRLKEHIQYKMCRTYERFKLSPFLPTRKLTRTGSSVISIIGYKIPLAGSSYRTESCNKTGVGKFSSGGRG